MTEYERRLKRAARFGVQTSDVIGPQSETPAFQNMDLPVAGQHKIEKLTENISRIKMRQQKFKWRFISTRKTWHDSNLVANRTSLFPVFRHSWSGLVANYLIDH